MKTESIPSASAQETPITGTYHRSCANLIYDTYIAIKTGEKGVEALQIEGTTPIEELESAWQDIQQERSSLIKTDKTDSVFEAWKKVLSYQWKIKFMEQALRLMRAQYEYLEDDPTQRHNAEIAEKIMLMGFPLIEDSDDPESYYAQIDAVEMEAKSLIVFFNQARAEYEPLRSQNEHDEGLTATLTRQDFEKELMVLSKFMGYPIRARENTVSEVCSVTNLYFDHMKTIQK